MFQASLCPPSGAQEYYTVVAACGISCCEDVKNNFVSLCGTQIPHKLTKLFFTFLQHEIPRNTLELLMVGIVMPETC